MASAVLVIAGIALAGAVLSNPSSSAAPAVGDGELTPLLAKKLAAAQRYAPGSLGKEELDEGGAYAADDWLKLSVDGQDNGPPAFYHFATARNDWHGLLGRPAFGTGKWVPLGPTNGLNDLTNLFRDRTVYTTGTENFSGRATQAVISPDCKPAPEECTMWVASTNGGVWRTDNALATDLPATPENEGPAWEFISGNFEQQNTSSLELDPNDHKTLWAGTGEPNACGSGCEVGVGVYRSTDQRKGWEGPLGEKHFFGRGVGSIEVKPGDSKTIFVATGRATRGISNNCCGGTDALIPNAPHFGIWRSTDAGKSWLLVNQGAEELCVGSPIDDVSLGNTDCSPRGARRVKIDPVDPNTVYASFFARGIWRSRENGDPGTWEQIMRPFAPERGTINGNNVNFNNERDEFDLVVMPGGETRMYVGQGGGQAPNATATGIVSVPASFRRNDAVREAPAAAVQATWQEMTSPVVNSPGWSSSQYCDPQCSYDNYVYAPANPDNAPLSGADHDVVYLSGANLYNENNTGTGRSNGRAVLLSTDGGATFTDMTEDDRSSSHPGALHPDHHALVVNPLDWKQFFDIGDGGVNRSNGVFVNDSADCTTPPHSFVVPARVAFCQFVLSRVPQRLDAINRGLRTIHMYTMDYDRTNPGRFVAGTQDNGSWETVGSTDDWLQINIADGGPNRLDAAGLDQQWALTAFQFGAMMARYNPMQQYDVNWISDTLSDPTSVPPFALEASAFIVPAVSDPVNVGMLFTGREHVFRATNYGRPPLLASKEAHRANCNIWNGSFADINESGAYDLPGDRCDSWEPLGDPAAAPGSALRMTGPGYGTDRQGLYVSVTQRAPSDAGTLWVATGTGRIFVSKNANNPDHNSVVFDRIDNDPTAGNDPPRYPTDIYVDPENPNHAWITYSGYNAKTPTTPGHVFEVFYVPNASTFVVRDGHKINGYGDIPANSIVVTTRGTYYVATDYGVVVKEPNSTVWKMSPAGLPNGDVADLVYAPERDVLYAATHSQGAWELKVQ
jgi:hypothetical protein